MKRTNFWFLVLIFTFALGGAVVFVWLNREKSANQQSQVPPTPVQKADVPKELQVFEYCELANNPEKYDGEVVRVKTKLQNSIHGLFFDDDNCSRKTMAVVFNTEREIEITKKLESVIESEKSRFWSVAVIARGKFSLVKRTEKNDALVHTVELRFEILEIEKISKE